jgi:hypothetical protein
MLLLEHFSFMTPDQFPVTGLAVINDPVACQFLNPVIPQIEWEQHWDDTRQPKDDTNLRRALEQTRKYIFDFHLSKHFVVCELEKMEFHEGIDVGSFKWHNDGNEGHNATVVLHFTDMSKHTGGALSVQNTSTNDVVQYYPLYGDITIFSQKPNFNHRVEPMLLDVYRIGAFFDCILRP